MTVIDEIKARLDLVDYIKQQGVALKQSGAYYKAPCPFHSEKTPSFMVSAQRQTWRCYGACGEGGDLISFAMKQDNLSFPEAIEALCQQLGIKREKYDKPDSASEGARQLLYQAHAYFMAGFHDSPALSYWQSRHFTLEQASIWGIGYASKGWDTLTQHFLAQGANAHDLVKAGLSRQSEGGQWYDYFRHRLMIPIHDSRGRLTGFGARALRDEDTPKYLNSPSSVFEKERHLFGYDKARDSISKKESVLVVEGYLDVIACHSQRYTNAVAPMGTALTETQRKLLGDHDVWLALDGDEAGRASTRRIVERLRGHEGRVKVVCLSSDPDEAIRAGTWQNDVQNALSAIEWLVRQEAVIGEDAPESERVHKAQQVMKALAGFGGAIEQAWAKTLIAKQLDITTLWLYHSKIEPAPPRLRIVSAPPAPIKAPIEAYLMRAFLKDVVSYLAVSRQALYELEQPPLGMEDFVCYPHPFSVMCEACTRTEPLEYIYQQLSPDVVGWDGIEPISKGSVVLNTLYLRLETLSRQIDEIVDLGEHVTRQDDLKRILILKQRLKKAMGQKMRMRGE